MQVSGQNLFTFQGISQLERIYEHLASGDRFICTLHNPPQRLRSIDGQLRLVGTYPESEGQTTLLFWSLSTYDETTSK